MLLQHHGMCPVCAAAGGMTAPDLEKFSQEVERLQLAALEVDMLCTHTVRTGRFYTPHPCTNCYTAVQCMAIHSHAGALSSLQVLGCLLLTISCQHTPQCD